MSFKVQAWGLRGIDRGSLVLLSRVYLIRLQGFSFGRSSPAVLRCISGAQLPTELFISQMFRSGPPEVNNANLFDSVNVDWSFGGQTEVVNEECPPRWAGVIWSRGAKDDAERNIVHPRTGCPQNQFRRLVGFITWSPIMQSHNASGFVDYINCQLAMKATRIFFCSGPW